MAASRLATVALFAALAAGACTSSTSRAPTSPTPAGAPAAAPTPPVASPVSAPGTASAPSTAPVPVPPGTAPPAAPPPPAPAVGLPDPAFTPGATDPDVTAATLGRTICMSGWTSSVRPPEGYTEQIKRLEAGTGGAATYAGVTYPVHGFGLADPDISHYELDHLIPLELGGSPADPRNLWMEAYAPPKGSAPPGTGSQTKDTVENAAHAAVCGGRMALGDAQQAVRTDWLALGVRLGVVTAG